jgi:uroporphyrinogen decarboxylase
VDAPERIRRTIAFEPCDRPPVIAQVFAHAAIACGRSVDAYVASGAVAAECQLAAHARYGYDAVFAVIDLTLEAEALGGEVQWRSGLYPAVRRPPFAIDAPFERLAAPDPRSAGRLPQVLEMAGRLRSALGERALVVGLVQGPMTLAVQLVGMEQALCLAADEPDRFVALLEYATRISRAFGLAQLAAGAHVVLVFDPAACPEVVPSTLFREMIGPCLRALFAAFREAGARATWLHVAGCAGPILPRYAALGVDIGNFDYCVEPEALLRALGDTRLCLDGNVKPLSFVTAGPDEIAADCERLLGVFRRRGGFILSSGCEIPPESREDNVAALVRSAVAWRGGVERR